MKIFYISAILMSLSICSFADNHPQGKELFKRFDANGDGKISTAEHEKAIEEMAKSDVRDLPKWMLMAMDLFHNQRQPPRLKKRSNALKISKKNAISVWKEWTTMAMV